jgi:putative ABC transport system permease protein
MLTYSDALELTRFPAEAVGRSISFSSYLPVKTLDRREAELMSVRAVTHSFFKMFEVPILQGSPWSAQDDEDRAPLAVVSNRISQRMFGGEAVGKELLIAGKTYTIVGVRKDWRLFPRFYDLSQGIFAKPEEIFVSTEVAIDAGTEPSMMVCWADPGPLTSVRQSPCGWIDGWLEFSNPNDATKFETALRNQISDIGLDDAEGRVKLTNVSEWLAFKQILPRDIRLQTYLAVAFLVMCTVNVAGVLLMKYYDRRHEMAIRRALGASKTLIAWHVVSESIILVLAGTLLGMIAGAISIEAIQLSGGEYGQVVELSFRTLLYVGALGAALSISGGLVATAKIAKSSTGTLMGGAP